MSQDIISDALNQIMNAKRAKKEELKINKISNLLVKLLEIMKHEGYINFEKQEGNIVIKILKLNECKAIKPRYYVGVSEFEKYMKRFLPARNFGKMIISTNKGLIDIEKAIKLNIGGSLIAYFY